MGENLNEFLSWDQAGKYVTYSDDIRLLKQKKKKTRQETDGALGTFCPNSSHALIFYPAQEAEEKDEGADHNQNR